MNKNKTESKKSKRWIWIFLLVLIIMLSVFQIIATSILNKYYEKESITVQNVQDKQEKSKDIIKKDALKYLEERYGEEFVITSVRGRSYAYDYINMYAYPKSHQEEAYEFKIQGRYNEEGILEYTDSYVMIKLRDDYEAYVDPIIDEYFDEYKFYIDFDSEWMTSNIPANAKLEDLWELKANIDYPLPRLIIYLRPSQSKMFTKGNIIDMSKHLALKGFRGPIYITCYDIDSLFEAKNRNTKREFTSQEANNSKWHNVFVNDEENIDYR